MKAYHLSQEKEKNTENIPPFPLLQKNKTQNGPKQKAIPPIKTFSLK